MLGQTSLLDGNTSLASQVEADQAAVSGDVSSQRRTRVLWTGLGLAACGVAACALYALASRASLEFSLRGVAFNPAPVRHRRNDHARPTAFLDDIPPGGSAHRPFQVSGLLASTSPRNDIAGPSVWPRMHVSDFSLLKLRGGVGRLGSPSMFMKDPVYEPDLLYDWKHATDKFQSFEAYVSSQLHLRGRVGRRGSPLMFMRDPATVPNLRDDWKRATDKFQSFEEYALAATPRKVNLNVGKVIEDWHELLREEVLEITRNNDEWTGDMNKKWWTVEMLDFLSGTLAANMCDFLFGFAFAEASAENPQALASVRFANEYDPSGKLADLARQKGFHRGRRGRIVVAEVSVLVAKPNARQKGAGRELLNKIIQWAALRGKLVVLDPANSEIQTYYESIGFVPHGYKLVYSAVREAEPLTQGLASLKARPNGVGHFNKTIERAKRRDKAVVEGPATGDLQTGVREAEPPKQGLLFEVAF